MKGLSQLGLTVATCKSKKGGRQVDATDVSLHESKVELQEDFWFLPMK